MPRCRILLPVIILMGKNVPCLLSVRLELMWALSEEQFTLNPASESQCLLFVELYDLIISFCFFFLANRKRLYMYQRRRGYLGCLNYILFNILKVNLLHFSTLTAQILEFVKKKKAHVSWTYIAKIMLGVILGRLIVIYIFLCMNVFVCPWAVLGVTPLQMTLKWFRLLIQLPLIITKYILHLPTGSLWVAMLPTPPVQSPNLSQT